MLFLPFAFFLFTLLCVMCLLLPIVVNNVVYIYLYTNVIFLRINANFCVFWIVWGAFLVIKSKPVCTTFAAGLQTRTMCLSHGVGVLINWNTSFCLETNLITCRPMRSSNFLQKSIEWWRLQNLTLACWLVALNVTMSLSGRVCDVATV